MVLEGEDKGDEEDLGLLTPEIGQDSRCLRVSELLKCSVQNDTVADFDLRPSSMRKSRSSAALR